VIYSCIRNDIEGLRSGPASRLKRVDWHRELAIAKRWGVASLLIQPLNNSGIALPESLRRELQGAYHKASANTINLEAASESILTALKERGVLVVLLKGAAMSRTEGWNTRGRPMADLDILVHREDLSKSLEALDALGYAADQQPRDLRESWLRDMLVHQAFPRVNRGRTVPVEVHWNILNEPNPFTLPVAVLWENVQPAGASSGLRLAPETQLLHIALHASWSHTFNMRRAWLSDIWRITTAQDPKIN
jgi:hypothetical protein